jgi:hypothetical protein
LRRLLIALILLGGIAAPASALERCDVAFTTYMRHLGERADKIPVLRLVMLHRQAVRIFYACDTGDLPDPENKFRRLEDG